MRFPSRLRGRRVVPAAEGSALAFIGAVALTDASLFSALGVAKRLGRFAILCHLVGMAACGHVHNAT